MKNQASSASTANHSHRKLWIASILVVFLLQAMGIGFGIYADDYYHASEEASAALNDTESYTVQSVDGGLAFVPDDPTAGVIFYPGGKVEHTAYAPLAAALAERGILCIICEMPFRLAVLDINAADGMQENFPEIENWMIGGHSLGGSMAAYYVANHTTEYSGLFLLGAFSTADLSDSGLNVLCIYGSEDGVMSREKYETYKSNLPTDFTELVIEGGCHSYFGSYGMQVGDGSPTITREEQLEQTVKAIQFVSESQ